jgi:serine-type D-Ala-D-Ala carboxypeptidase/endopeptidase (penicillin-binding protein 4)
MNIRHSVRHFMRRVIPHLLLAIVAGAHFNASAQGIAGGAPPAVMPFAVADALARINIPAENVAIVVREIGAPAPALAPVLSLNADKAMNPASVMKLFTTYAGLELLGPGYTWKTEVHAAGEIRRGTLYGDLVLKGGGDPKLTVEHFEALLKQLRQRGLRTIRGDLILDHTLFENPAYDPAGFDGEPLRAYNVGANALLVNFKTVRFLFDLSVDGKAAVIVPDVRPVQLEVVNRIKLVDGVCGDWQGRIAREVETPSPLRIKLSFSGNYARSCGAQTWNIALLDHNRFVGGVFADIWKELGGSWKGLVKVTATPADAHLLATLESPSLAEVVRDINKYSNNVMARQLFLTISAEKSGPPGTVARSTEIIREWLAKKGINAPELVFENGAGLSRAERSSAATLAGLLTSAWGSSVMPEFIASMPLLGVDGTLRKRARSDAVAGQAHVKTGTLNDAAAIAGYVQDMNGRRWLVVMMINHANAPQAQAAQDALLAWVHAGANLNAPGAIAPAAPPLPAAAFKPQ